MRMRATVAAVSGALTLSALVVPAVAQAADGTRPSFDSIAAGAAAELQTGLKADAPASAEARGGVAARAAAALDISVSGVSVNKNKDIVVGTTGGYQVPITYTVNHSGDLGSFASIPLIYHGSSISTATWGYSADDVATCADVSATAVKCSATFTFLPAELINSDAGTWRVAVIGATETDDVTLENVATRKVLRTSKVTVDAAPEPVKKGATITVTGKLTRADWDTNTYVGYGSQSVVLQYRPKTSTTYTNVKGIKSTSTGALKTTVKASASGYYRFVFNGSPTGGKATATGDYIGVK
ncbi:hypothetical protein [Streptomyces sp. CRN 30]|uniref:hypothetical protein n=1 Tax=Streptomyces sp. CRN 30 TaxID=3075613 RepID=UPI002A7F9804|nr:hypothetical protein [Streptomyces sp. CRN 30]